MTFYDALVHDFGLAREDSARLGYECRSFTLDPGGGHPTFVMPRKDVEPIT